MDDNMILSEQLKQAWKSLGFEVKRDKKLKIEAFSSAFSQTYSLLSTHMSESSLDKKYIEMIVEAFLFANIKDNTLDNTCLAALILTERMLKSCLSGNNPSSAGQASIFIFETREEILIDFGDVNESINKLTNVIENIFWKKV